MENDFLSSMANASRGAVGGLGTDGVVRGDLFSISVTGNAGIATTGSFGSFKTERNSLPGVGLGVQPAVTLGLNAKFLPNFLTFGLDSSKLDYFFHFGSFDTGTLSSDFGFNITNFGLIGRYWLKDPVSALWAFRWDGLSLSTGVQYSSTSATVQSNLDFTAGTGAGAVNWAPVADFGISASTFTIPIDIRTGITLLKFLTLYTGAGARFNFGSAQTTGQIGGPIRNTAAGQVGTGTLDLTSEGQNPTLLSARFTLGSQLNFGPAKFFIEGGYSTPKVADVALGFRFVW
jgi:hypothetical protein